MLNSKIGSVNWTYFYTLPVACNVDTGVEEHTVLKNT